MLCSVIWGSINALVEIMTNLAEANGFLWNWSWQKIGAAVNNSNFTPFGGGQRLCPGLELSRLEISVFLHHLVTTYSYVLLLFLALLSKIRRIFLSYSRSNFGSHNPVMILNPTVQLGSWRGRDCLLPDCEDEEEAPNQSHTNHCYMSGNLSHVDAHVRSYQASWWVWSNSIPKVSFCATRWQLQQIPVAYASSCYRSSLLHAARTPFGPLNLLEVCSWVVLMISLWNSLMYSINPWKNWSL